VTRVANRCFGTQFEQRAGKPSPLAGEGGEPANAGEPGEGCFFARTPHPDARHSASKTRVYALMARVHPLPQGERVSERAAEAVPVRTRLRFASRLKR
jgi:hypothetical protein